MSLGWHALMQQFDCGQLSISCEAVLGYGCSLPQQRMTRCQQLDFDAREICITQRCTTSA
jgi:hypothetical protein